MENFHNCKGPFDYFRLIYLSGSDDVNVEPAKDDVLNYCQIRIFSIKSMWTITNAYNWPGRRDQLNPPFGTQTAMVQVNLIIHSYRSNYHWIREAVIIFFYYEHPDNIAFIVGAYHHGTRLDQIYSSRELDCPGRGQLC